MLRRIRALIGLGLVIAGALLALAVPAGAQQLVDAGKEGDGSGGLAFVLMVVTIVLMAGSLFYMDHVRRSRLPQRRRLASVLSASRPRSSRRSRWSVWARETKRVS